MDKQSIAPDYIDIDYGDRIERRPNPSKIKSPSKVLKNERQDKKEVKHFGFQHASPVKSAFSNAFSPAQTTLTRAGYSRKEQVSAFSRYKRAEVKRRDAKRKVDKMTRGVLGF